MVRERCSGMGLWQRLKLTLFWVECEHASSGQLPEVSTDVSTRPGYGNRIVQMLPRPGYGNHPGYGTVWGIRTTTSVLLFCSIVNHILAIMLYSISHTPYDT